MEARKTYTIFLVDDDAVYLKVLERDLAEYYKPDCIIKTFVTGEQCLNNLHLNPNIIVLDYYLNSEDKNAMNGIQILNKIKVFDKNIQVIILSGQERFEVAINSIKHGAFDYVVKSESAFVRLKQVINNVIHEMELKDDVKKFATWNVVVAIVFVIILTLNILYYKTR